MTCTGAAICLPVLILYNVVPKICFFKGYTALRSFKYTFIYLFVQFDAESPSYNVKFLCLKQSLLNSITVTSLVDFKHFVCMWSKDQNKQTKKTTNSLQSEQHFFVIDNMTFTLSHLWFPETQILSMLDQIEPRMQGIRWNLQHFRFN